MFFVLFSPLLKTLRLIASTVCQSSLFHLLMNLFEKNACNNPECTSFYYFKWVASGAFKACWIVHTADTDNTKLSCLVCPCRRCEHNWRQDKTVLSCLDPVSNLQLFSLKYIEDYWKLENWKQDHKTHRNWVETRQNSLVLSAVVFTPPTRTRQNRLLLLSIMNSSWIHTFWHLKHLYEVSSIPPFTQPTHKFKHLSLSS